jgi:hypothetical protein
MQFFLYEIVARLVAIYLCFICGRKLQHGFVEREITPWRGLLDFNKNVFHRDTVPVLYWMEMGQVTIGLVAGLLVAIFGWWHPNT